ncbi:hypothetical protein ACIOC2_01450 [Streptomyces sp. NPDC088337]|uniref:hypothetical protein n=1 Tax=unclassified Streptomyces TaxID=2593676 RepID=UPI00380E4A24
MTAPVDDNEQAVKARLIALIDGPAAAAAQPDAVTAAAAGANAQATAAAQPQPQPIRTSAAAADGWWDALYAEEQHTIPVPGEERTAQPQSQRKPRAIRSRIPDWWTGKHVDLTPEEDEPDNGQQHELDPEEEDTPGTGPATDLDEEEAAEEAADEPDPGTQPQPDRSRTRLHKAARRIRPTSPAAPASSARALVDEPAPRLALVDAYARVPLRIRWLILHGTAAAAGYRIGLVQFSTRSAAWIAENGLLQLSSLVWYAVGFGCELLRRRFAHRILVVRWTAALPIASIVTGTLLYGTGWHELELPL